MKKIIYFHIGYWKTGTTALQNYFVINQERLKEHNIVYPDIGRYGTAHHQIAWQLGASNLINKPAGIDPLGQLFLLANESKEDILISSEALLARFIKKDIVSEIRKNFHDRDIKIIIYIRRQDLHLESQYLNKIKNGFPIQDFFSWCKEKNTDYYKRLTQLAGLFGRDNLLVRVYEREQFQGGDIFEDFLNIIGIDSMAGFKPAPGNSNPPLSSSVLELCRIANEQDDSVLNKKLFNHMLWNAFTDEASTQPFQAKGLLNQQQRQEILNEIEASNRKVALEFFNKADGRLFIEPVDDKTEPEAATADYDQEVLVRNFSRIWHRTLRELEINDKQIEGILRKIKNR